MLTVKKEETRLLENVYAMFSNDPSVLELELRITNNISRHVFTKLISRLKALSDYSEISVDEYLNVSYQDVNAKQLHVRHTIPFDELTNYCNGATSYSTYEKVFKYPVYVSGKPQHFTFSELPVRCNLKYEVPWSHASNQFATTEQVDPNTSRLIEKEAKVNYGEQLKVFRNIKRFSFRTSDGLFRVDCSMVQSSLTPTMNINSTNLPHKKVNYEIEIECLKGNEDPKSFRNKLLTHIYTILQSLQESLFVMPTSEIIAISSEYEAWLNRHNDSYILKMGGKRKMTMLRGSSAFLNPKPVSIQHTHLKPSSKINIVHNYSVTDKADGVSALLYISNSGKCYLIDHSLQFQDTGITNTDFKNSLFNGELITRTKDGLTCCDYMMFDSYIVQDQNCMQDNLMSLDASQETRLYHMTRFLDSSAFEFSNHGFSNAQPHPVRFLAKKFHQTAPGITIFEAAKEIWSKRHNFKYKLDGLIFTPIDKPVAYSHRNSEYFSNISATWNYNIKWKPAEENTIDFLVFFDSSVHHDKKGAYKKVTLFVGDRKDRVYDIRAFSWKNSRSGFEHKFVRWPINHASNVVLSLDGQQLLNDTVVECTYNFHEKDGYRWQPLRTRHDKTAHYKNSRHTQQIQFEVFNRIRNGTETKEDAMTCRNLKKQFIHVGWMKKGDVLTQSVAARIATNHVQKPYDIPHNIQSGNNIRTAKSIWKLIQNPVTEEKIMGDKYYTTTTDRRKKTSEMYRKFHNQIKFSLLEIANYKKKPLRLFDIGCGQGGDINKWIKTKFGLVVAVDKVAENVNRALERQSKLKTAEKEKIVFLVADMSKSLKGGEAVRRNEDIERLKRIEAKMKRPAYDVLSCQFAIHYFFQNSNTWSTFLQNVLNIVKCGGLFIGTCMHGETVHNHLENIGDVSGSFGRIQKAYDRADFLSNSVPLGYKITTEIKSIGTQNDEYLVHTGWFQKQMKLHNFELFMVKKHPVFKVGNALFGDIYKNFEKQSKHIHLSDEEKTFSFMNQYFVFKRGKSSSDYKFALHIWNDDVRAHKEHTLNFIQSYFLEKGFVVDETFCKGFKKKVIKVKSSPNNNQLSPESPESPESPDAIAQVVLPVDPVRASTDVSETNTEIEVVVAEAKDEKDEKDEKEIDAVRTVTSEWAPLKNIRSYKLEELKSLAETFDIQTKKIGKRNVPVSRTKKELYQDIVVAHKKNSEGKNVTYIKGGSSERAKIIDVHNDDEMGPYYTIELGDGRTVQTIGDYVE